ncbi:MAG: hypothetical protein M1829_001675 [Trizodia sp. TS-e1964]|nr:MAG: hypothetical protein M1829_001675 [Trizodia sp. TS-e1964]
MGFINLHQQLREHMNNPVAWQLWGEEAFSLAKKHNRLMFVSFGFAACHWCRVMNRDSFENEDVARLLNANFIPIIVDKDERKDIDTVYLNYVQATTGTGGWPLNVFLTPDRLPVFGGTYWPGPNCHPDLQLDVSPVGFIDVLAKLASVWRDQRERCLISAKEILTELEKFSEEGNLGDGAVEEGLDIDLVEESYQHFAAKYDGENGGFSEPPKFPTPVNLQFLLRLSTMPPAVRHIVGEEECDNALFMAMHTLQKLTRGGLHDHIGHGFARYSVTPDWSLPHFEKMLYDQAQLLSVFLDAFLLSPDDPEMLGAVYDIADYICSPPIASPDGAFFSSEGADSLYHTNDTERREGAYYVWTLKEFDSILGEKEAEICAKFWNVNRHGNVSPENDSHDEFINQNVLAIVSSPSQLASEFGMSKEDIVRVIQQAKSKLREHREKNRPRPNLDDKIIVSWNGLAIGALARVSAVLQDIDTNRAARYLSAAEKGVSFIRKTLWDPQTKRLKRVCYRGGLGDVPGFAEDYAFLIQGLIELYEATFKEQYLQFADMLQDSQIAFFWPQPPASSSIGFYSTEALQPDLIMRLKDGMDGTEPSTNGISAQNLYRLGSMLDDQRYSKLAHETVRAFEVEILQHPFLYNSMMSCVVARDVGVRSIVVCHGKVNVNSGGSKQRKLAQPEVHGDGKDLTPDESSHHAIQTVRAELGGLRTLVNLHHEPDEPGAIPSQSSLKEAPSTWLRKRNRSLAKLGRDGKQRVIICEKGVCKEALDLQELEKVLAELSGVGLG